MPWTAIAIYCDRRHLVHPDVADDLLPCHRSALCAEFAPPLAAFLKDSYAEAAALEVTSEASPASSAYTQPPASLCQPEQRVVSIFFRTFDQATAPVCMVCG